MALSVGRSLPSPTRNGYRCDNDDHHLSDWVLSSDSDRHRAGSRSAIKYLSIYKGLLPGRNEILRIRDSENGSIRLFFKNEQEYEEAYESFVRKASRL